MPHFKKYQYDEYGNFHPISFTTINNMLQQMRNLILKLLVYLYSYYNKGNTADIAYFMTLSAFLMILIFHYMTLAAGFGWNHFENISQYPKFLRYLIFSIISLPFYLTLYFVFPKSKILRQQRKETNLKRGRLIAFGYFVFSFALFTVTMLTVNGVIF
ncbi:MAG TPA: hypothetical protein PKD51_18445 [Saprospiraceae bacterium]|nr:hypothetical protein [Saprospiraceae bacterium]